MSDGNMPLVGSSGLDKYRNLPGNSNKTKAEMELEQKTKEEIRSLKKSANSSQATSDQPEVKKVTNGIRQKKSLGTKFKETFLSEESDSVGSYIFWDIIVPSAKEIISDIVTGAVNILLYGDSGSRSNRKGGRRISGGYREYSNMSSSVVKRNDSDDRRYGRRNRRYAEEILIVDDDYGTARQNASRVLADMQDSIADYDRCTLADYYQFVGVSWEATDKNWGWTNLNGVKPRAVHGGCVLDLPEIEPV